ncbi:hypothetical protein ABT040_04740 [Streptomyces sp. NPDC002688]
MRARLPGHCPTRSGWERGARGGCGGCR